MGTSVCRYGRMPRKLKLTIDVLMFIFFEFVCKELNFVAISVGCVKENNVLDYNHIFGSEIYIRKCM